MMAKRQQPRIRTLCTAVIVGQRYDVWVRVEQKEEQKYFVGRGNYFLIARLFAQHTGIVRTKGHFDAR